MNYKCWIFSSSLYFRLRLQTNQGKEEIAEKEEEGGEVTEGEVGDQRGGQEDQGGGGGVGGKG